LTRRLHAYACEGANENSWQSRPRHAVLSPTLGRLPPPRETAADLARVMLLLDASTIARNVGRILYWQRAVARIPTWAAAPTAFQTHCQRGRPQDFVAGTHVPRSGLPRVFVRALASISMQMLGGRCSCTRSVRSTQPAAAQHSPRVRQPFDLSTTKCKRDASVRVLHHTSPPGRPWGALPRPSWREMCGAVHDQTCRSARNRQNNNPRRCRSMRGTRGAARTRDLAAAAAPARVSAPGIALCSLGCISFHFETVPPPTSRVPSTHAAEANLNVSRFCLHGGSCPTPPSCTTAACIPHHLCV
jgi:hypothetical protein